MLGQDSKPPSGVTQKAVKHPRATTVHHHANPLPHVVSLVLSSGYQRKTGIGQTAHSESETAWQRVAKKLRHSVALAAGNKCLVFRGGRGMIIFNDETVSVRLQECYSSAPSSWAVLLAKMEVERSVV